MPQRASTLLPAVALALLLASRAGLGAQGLTLYVAPNGNDAWSGTLAEPRGGDGPFATIPRARDAIRRLRAAQPALGPVTVLLRGGVYRLAEPLVLGPQDSQVTYEAAPNERPVLSGGRIVAGWRPLPDGLWAAAVPEAAQGKGLFQQLWVNGERRRRARRRHTQISIRRHGSQGRILI